ncbi:MAG: molybdenum ABC transporter ATP-binding protein [Acidobacteria bacterium]|nr:molybdenum ABC transporter ATP-binding protein [Acidobacteriota bacterium]
MAFAVTLDFTLQQGPFRVQLDETVRARAIALFGRSGAGKTTVLDAVAGLRRPTDGRIVVGETTLFASRDGLDLPARHRRMGYVPQDAALFPHMTLRRNVTYGAGHGRGDTLAKILAVLDLEALIERRVDQLSGGEKKRAAIARALMADPRMLLLDEPLSGLDAALRQRVLPYLIRVRDELETPMLYVSHQAEEVRAIADWVIKLDGGRVVSSGPPDEVELA